MTTTYINKLQNYSIQCQYCNQTLSDDRNSGVFTCHNHPVSVNYICSSYTKDNIKYIDIDLKYYIIFANQTTIYQLVFYLTQKTFNLIETSTISEGAYGSSKILITLNYLPDVSPEQAQTYLNKLLNLKIFS